MLTVATTSLPLPLNLDRLSDSTFVLSTVDEDELYDIANGATTQAGLAKSMLTILTDTIFPVMLPEGLEDRSASEAEKQPRKEMPSTTGLVLVPNPADDVVSVLLPGNVGENAILRLYNLNGELKQQQAPRSTKIELDTRELLPGIYVLALFDGEKIIHQAKLLVQR